MAGGWGESSQPIIPSVPNAPKSPRRRRGPPKEEKPYEKQLELLAQVWNSSVVLFQIQAVLYTFFRFRFGVCSYSPFKS